MRTKGESKLSIFLGLPKSFAEFSESNDYWILDILQSSTSAEVEELYRRHSATAQPYIGVIAEIAGDPRATQATLRGIWDKFGSELEVAAGLATNPSLPTQLLRVLAGHQDEVVREHAEVALSRRSRK